MTSGENFQRLDCGRGLSPGFSLIFTLFLSVSNSTDEQGIESRVFPRHRPLLSSE